MGGVQQNTSQRHARLARPGYYDLILLGVTAQLALTHHLDDERSKEIAYRHNKSAAEHRRMPMRVHMSTRPLLELV
jgi:hypothetical protein